MKQSNIDGVNQNPIAESISNVEVNPKAFEDRVRRLAARQGYKLSKSRWHNELNHQGQYQPIYMYTNTPLIGWNYRCPQMHKQ